MSDRAELYAPRRGPAEGAPVYSHPDGPTVQDAVKAALTRARERVKQASEDGRRARKRAARAPIEATDYAAMMRRMIRAHGRRVADADVEDLAELMDLHAVLDEAIAYAVRESRARHGRSWADIARATGSTKQAAQQRWGRPALAEGAE